MIRKLRISDMRFRSDAPPRIDELDILRDLMSGGRHSRSTVVRCGVSLPTADRWLRAIWIKIPGIVATRVGRATWFEWAPPGGGGRAEWDAVAKTFPGPYVKRAAPKTRRKPGRAVS